MILPSVWRDEVCRGLDPDRAARALAARGLLRRASDGRHLTDMVRLGNHGRLRVYRVSGPSWAMTVRARLMVSEGLRRLAARVITLQIPGGDGGDSQESA